jgi:HlyD family secretion protein
VKLRASADTPLPTRLEGELNVAQAEWRVAQAALEKTQIRAPADGVVLRVDAKNGELAVPAAGPPIMSIGDVSALRVRAEVNEQDLGRIRVGQAVLVRAGAFHGREFDGRVSSIARVVGPSRINSGDPRKFSDVDVLEVLVDLPNPGPLVVVSRSTSISGRTVPSRSRRSRVCGSPGRSFDRSTLPVTG